MRLALRAIALLVAALPWRALRPLGAALGWLAGPVLRIRRAHVVASMRRAGIARPAATARRMYASLGAGLLELLWMSARRTADLDAVVTFAPEALAAVERCRVRGRGVVVATAHTGNWDLVACAAARVAPLTVVTKRLSVRGLDRFWQSARAERGVRLVFPRGAAGATRRALAEGGLVGLLVDQAPERGRSVVDTSFLGAPARCDLAPALLASRARSPILVALGRRLPDGTHRVEVPLVIEPPDRPSRAWAVDATIAVERAVEAFVREHPDQWLWMHRRWKGASATAFDAQDAARDPRACGPRSEDVASCA